MSKLPKDSITIYQYLKEAETEREYIEHLIEHHLANRVQKINVKFQKTHEAARVPTRAHWNDAAYDIWSFDMEEKDDGRLMYKTGIKMAMPDNYLALVFPRSSTSKRNLILGNCVAVFDAGYRGEILIPYKTLHYATHIYNNDALWVNGQKVTSEPELYMQDYNTTSGVVDKIVREKSRYDVSPERPERIAQILFIPRTDVAWEEVDSVDESERGEGNFGHTGQQEIKDNNSNATST